MTKISDNITLAEAIKSQAATRHSLNNTPGEKEIENMKRVAREIFEPLRAVKGIPIAVTSFYRSLRVNSLIGGSSTSQHVKGEAMDIDGQVFGGWSNMEIALTIIQLGLEFDQLILEFGTEEEPDWIHVSKKATGNRGQVLRAYKFKGKTKYKTIVL